MMMITQRQDVGERTWDEDGTRQVWRLPAVPCRSYSRHHGARSIRQHQWHCGCLRETLSLATCWCKHRFIQYGRRHFVMFRHQRINPSKIWRNTYLSYCSLSLFYFLFSIYPGFPPSPFLNTFLLHWKLKDVKDIWLRRLRSSKVVMMFGLAVTKCCFSNTSVNEWNALS